jgi:hypothetical protein
MEKTEYNITTLYKTCRYRDMCLRYLGENPAQWINANVTPCPCGKEFFTQILAYARVCEYERLNHVEFASRSYVVTEMTRKRPRKQRDKNRHIPLSQERLAI